MMRIRLSSCIRPTIILIIFSSTLIGTLGCGRAPIQPTASQPPMTIVVPTTPSQTISIVSPTVTAPQMIEPTETAILVTEPTLEPLPAEPQTIQFFAEDGTQLFGTYYPAGIRPAPLIILFHWVRGNQTDWVEIAKWLQNRDETFSTWLPPMPKELTFAVFTFDFRGFGKSVLPIVVHWEPEGWLMDARAAVSTARQLNGVDPDQYLTIGTSIGGDAAVDVCVEGCYGALSFSPGGYLTIPYKEAVERLSKLPLKPRALCLAAEGDQDSAQACRSATGDHYNMVIYPGNAHGMELIKTGFDPDVGQILFDFVRMAYETP